MNSSQMGKRHAKRLLLSLARLSDRDPHVLVDLADLGKTVREAGLDLEKTKAAVQFLRQRGWARFEVRADKGCAQITPAGIAQAARLQMGLWRRLAHDRTIRIALLGSLVSNFLVLVVRELIP